MTVFKNLIIGSTSQLANYFPDEFVRVSSRSELTNHCNESWDTVYVCFGENRTYLADSKDSSITDEFYRVNHDLTVSVVNMFKNSCRRVVVYSTAELWNDCNGAVGIDTPFQYKTNHYIQSKYNMTTELKDKSRYPNVSVAYPFNFNGVYRKGDFLFGKVFGSILNRTQIQLGDTYYYRDIVHPKWAAEESMIDRVGVDFIIGSGRLVYVNDLIRSLYSSFGLRYEDMVCERIVNPSIYRNRLFYSETKAKNSDTQSLLTSLIAELKEFSHAS